MHKLSKRILPDPSSALSQKVSPALRIRREGSEWIASSNGIFIQDGERCWIVRVTDLVLLESEGNHTRLHFGSNRPMMARSLNYLEERLDPAMFFRANRRTIINLMYVECIEPWVLSSTQVGPRGCGFPPKRSHAQAEDDPVNLGFVD